MLQVRPLFALGSLVATPGALAALVEAGVTPLDLLARHVSGDWGEVRAQDWELNNLAVRDGSRVFSAYVLMTGVKVWVITEWDRSATTLLLTASASKMT